MSFNIFEGMFSLIDSSLDTYVLDTTGEVIDYIAPVFNSMMVIWIAIWGYMLMFGKASEPLQEGVFRILRIGFILTIGLTVGTYSGLVVSFFTEAPEAIAAAMTGSPSTSIGASLDTLLTEIFNIAKEAWQEAGFGNPGMYLIAAAILIFGGFLAVSAAILIAVSKLATATLLAIGPIFIILLLFNPTQRFFESWVGMVVNMGLTLILGSAVGNLAIDITNAVMSTMKDAGAVMTSLASAVVLCVCYCICLAVLKQVPMMASALGGGVALAANGAIGSALNAMRPTNIRRQYRQAKRDIGLGTRAAVSPITGGHKAYKAYQKRFGAGNSITGS